jgi:hypothetical protein
VISSTHWVALLFLLQVAYLSIFVVRTQKMEGTEPGK